MKPASPFRLLRPTLCAIALASIGFAPTPALARPGDPAIAFNWGARTFLTDDVASVIHAAVVPNTGRTIVVVASDTGLRVQRLDVHGKPEPNYGVNGAAGFPAGTMVGLTTDAQARPIVLIEDGVESGRQRYLLARLDQAGLPDERFGPGGTLRLTLPVFDADGSSHPPVVARLVALADGSVLVVGDRELLRDRRLSRPWAVRVLPGRGLDESFGSAGFAAPPTDEPNIIPMPTLANRVGDVKPLPDGRWIVALKTGYIQGESRVFRFTADGKLDTTFGVGGEFRTRELDTTAVAVAGDGSIALVSNGSRDTRVIRLGIDGAPDERFGTGGAVRLAREAERPTVTMLAAFEHDSTRLLLGSRTWSRAKGKDQQSGLVERLTDRGTLDGTFGANGAVELDLGYTNDYVNALVPGDRNLGYAITVAGSGDRRPAITRLDGGTAGDFSPNLPLTVVNAANYSTRFAAESLVTLFYPPLTLPTGCKDFASCDKLTFNVEYELPTRPLSRRAVLKPVYASETQANIALPAALAGSQSAQFYIADANGRVLGQQVARIEPVAPAIFTANGSGLGTPAAGVLRIRDGAPVYEPVSAERIDLSGGDEVYLILYATGLRAPDLRVAATVRYPAHWIDKGIAANVTYAGPQGDYAGLDQINIRLPVAQLKAAGARGKASVQLEIGSASLGAMVIKSNAVEVFFSF